MKLGAMERTARDRSISVSFPHATTPPSTAPGLRRRFTLNAHTRSGVDSDAVFTMPASTIRVYFNAWYSRQILRAES